MTVTVWMLILVYGGIHNYGNVSITPDISTKEDCLRLGNEALKLGPVTQARCVPVKKVFPQ